MRVIVGVLRGGPSREYEASLKTGASVLAALDKNKYEARDIFIDRAGQWHMHGVPAAPERALAGLDVAFNALHGEYGEDGALQRLLDSLGIKYTGSGPSASAAAFNKHRTRQAVAALGIKIPYGAVVDAQKITDLEATARNLFRSMPQPSVARPIKGGPAVFADTYHGLLSALEEAFRYGEKVLVEEYIAGQSASASVIDAFRGERTYALVPQPNIFTDAEKSLIIDAARRVHEGLGLGHYSQPHFRVGRRGVYFTGAFALPHLYEDSTLHRALAEVGAPLPHFVDHIITLARQ